MRHNVKNISHIYDLTYNGYYRFLSFVKNFFSSRNKMRLKYVHYYRDSNFVTVISFLFLLFYLFLKILYNKKNLYC